MNEWDSMVIYDQWPYMTMLGPRKVVLQLSVKEYKLAGCCLRKVARNRRFWSKIVLYLWLFRRWYKTCSRFRYHCL